jgi:hypothetical protein
MSASTPAADPATASAASAGNRSLPARIAGVIFAPRATYADVVARPRFLGVLAFVVLLGSAGSYALMSTEVGQTIMVEQQVRQAEAFGRTLKDEDYARIERMAPYGKYFSVAAQVVGIPVVAAIIAGLAFAVFNAFMGGDGTFRQAYAVVAHSGVIITLSQLFGLPLAYARESLTGATNLGVFAPFLDENSFAARVLGAVDLFILWWILSLAIGLGVLYRKRTAPIATTLIVIYVAIGVVIAAVKTALSGA